MPLLSLPSCTEDSAKVANLLHQLTPEDVAYMVGIPLHDLQASPKSVQEWFWKLATAALKDAGSREQGNENH